MDPEAFGQKSGPGGGKKDSIFAGLAPASASGLRAEAETAAVLRQKMDSLERNLIAVVEKRLDEQMKAMAAGAKSASAEAERLHRRFEDIEKKLAELERRSGLAAAETKKDGELKDGALNGLASLLESFRGRFDDTAARLDDLETKISGLSDLTGSGQASAAKAIDEAASKIAATGEILGADIDDLQNAGAAGMAAIQKDVAGLRKDTAESISGLQKDTTAALNEVRKDAASAIADLQKDMAAGFAGLQKDGVVGLAGIKDMAESLAGMRKEMGDSLSVVPGMAESMGAVRKETGETLAGIRREMEENLSGMRKELDESLPGIRREMNENLAGIKKEMGESLAGGRKDTLDILEGLQKKIEGMSKAAADMQEKTEAAVKDDAARDAEIAAHLENLERKMHNFYEISRIEQTARDAAGKTTDAYLVQLAAQLDAFGKEIDGLKTFVSSERARAIEVSNQAAANTKEQLAGIGKSLEYFTKGIMRGQTRKEEEERVTREELKKKIELVAESFKRDSRLIGDRIAVGEKRMSDILQALEKALPEKYSAEVKTAADALRDVHEELQERAASFSAAIETFNRLAGEHKTRSELMEKSVEKVVGGNDALLRETIEKINRVVAQNGERFLVEFGEKNRAQFENLNKKYADALSSMRAMDAVYSSLDAVSRRLEAYQTKFEGFLTAVDKEQLATMLGVSGTRIRKNLDAIGEMLSEMKREAGYLDGVKKDMGDRIREAFKKD